MFSQLRPRNALRDAIDLVLKVARDDVFREYVSDRIWLAIGALFVFFFVSTVCAIDLMFKVAHLVSDSPLWLTGFALIVGAVVWAGGLLAQTYVFLIWLEGRAARRYREEQGIEIKVPHGFLAYLKYSRALPPWIVVLACVVLPLLIMASRAPLVALTLAVLAIATPAVFSKLDR